MKLFYAPGACSMSPHIVLAESGLPFEIERVDLKTKRTASGADFLAINPKGYVPALELDNGEILTEGPAIVQYVADLAPASKLAPPAGTLARARLQEWLHFIGTELHVRFGPAFDPATPEATRDKAVAAIERRYDWLEPQLATRSWLMGETFSAADAYLYTVASWSKWVKIDLNRWPQLKAYLKRVLERPAVQAMLKSEGLVK